MARRPTTPTEREFGKKIAELFGQRFEGSVEGPNQVGPYRISRVWTEEDLDDGDIEYHAHYAVEYGHDDPKVFENFAPFANWLSKEFDLDKYAAISQKETQLWVGVIAILVGLGLLIYLIVWAPGQSSWITYLLGAVIGTACGYVFKGAKAPK